MGDSTGRAGIMPLQANTHTRLNNLYTYIHTNTHIYKFRRLCSSGVVTTLLVDFVWCSVGEKTIAHLTLHSVLWWRRKDFDARKVLSRRNKQHTTNYRQPNATKQNIKQQQKRPRKRDVHWSTSASTSHRCAVGCAVASETQRRKVG